MLEFVKRVAHEVKKCINNKKIPNSIAIIVLSEQDVLII